MPAKKPGDSLRALALPSWPEWLIGYGVALGLLVLVLLALDAAGHAQWWLLSAVTGPILGLTLLRVVVRRRER